MRGAKKLFHALVISARHFASTNGVKTGLCTKLLAAQVSLFSYFIFFFQLSYSSLISKTTWQTEQQMKDSQDVAETEQHKKATLLRQAAL